MPKKSPDLSHGRMETVPLWPLLWPLLAATITLRSEAPTVGFEGPTKIPPTSTPGCRGYRRSGRRSEASTNSPSLFSAVAVPQKNITPSRQAIIPHVSTLATSLLRPPTVLPEETTKVRTASEGSFLMITGIIDSCNERNSNLLFLDVKGLSHCLTPVRKDLLCIGC